MPDPTSGRASFLAAIRLALDDFCGATPGLTWLPGDDTAAPDDIRPLLLLDKGSDSPSDSRPWRPGMPVALTIRPSIGAFVRAEGGQEASDAAAEALHRALRRHILMHPAIRALGRIGGEGVSWGGTDWSLPGGSGESGFSLSLTLKTIEDPAE